MKYGRCLCSACRRDPNAGIGAPAKHTNPPDGLPLCQCTEPTCACTRWPVPGVPWKEAR